MPVIVDSSDQLGTTNSSRRFKEDIETMDHKVSEAILKLKPVTFHYKGGDTKKAQKTPQFGLIAEDVAEVKSRPGGARGRRQAFDRALRCGERNVAQ
jgi:hypothetical protein